MVSVKDVCVSLGGREILHSVSFEIRKGMICGYVGPNGAGKTTTIKLLTGTLAPESGYILIDNADVVRNPMAVKKRLGYVPEAGHIYESFTPLEYLIFVCRMYGIDEDTGCTRAEALMRYWDLQGALNRRMVGFSKGMKQKVLISAALIHDPNVLLLDEPLNGLDAHAVLQIRTLLKNLATHGKTILYSSHILDAVEKIVDQVVVIRAGCIIKEGSPDEIMRATQADSLEIAFTSLTSTEDVQEKTDILIETAFSHGV